MTTTTTTETSLQQHPLSAAYPAMPEGEMSALVESIAKHGQREPGVIYEGMVLDGWHRYLACQRAGVEFRSVGFDGADPDAFVDLINDKRRHMNATQRVESQLRRMEYWRGRGAKSLPGRDLPPTTEAIAKAARASVSTVEQAKAAHRIGLGDEMLAGKVSAKAGAEIAKLPKKKRDKGVEAIKAGEEPKLPKPKVIKADPKFERLYEEVKAKLVEVEEKLTETTIDLEAVQIHLGNPEVRKIKAVLAELESVKRRRDELMRENEQQKKLIAYWKKKAGGK